MNFFLFAYSMPGLKRTKSLPSLGGFHESFYKKEKEKIEKTLAKVGTRGGILVLNSPRMESVCSICVDKESKDALLQCLRCHVCFHTACYFSNPAEDTRSHDAWLCEYCVRDEGREDSSFRADTQGNNALSAHVASLCISFATANATSAANMIDSVSNLANQGINKYKETDV